MNINGTYKFERLSKDNLHHLVPLFKLVYAKNLSIEFLKKKYDTSYVGLSYLGYIAFDKDKPVGFAGCLPMKMIINGEIKVVAQLVDSMSSPEVRGKGVFTHLFKLTTDLLVSSGVLGAFAFANQFSEPVVRAKFNWSYHSTMKAFVIKVPINPYVFIKNRLFRKTIPTYKFGNYMTDSYFENPFKSNSICRVVYDNEYYKYKLALGTKLIMIDGIKVWIKISSVLTIGSMEHCSKEHFFQILQKLKALCNQSGLHKIIFQFTENVVFTDYLKEQYEPVDGNRIIYVDYGSLPNNVDFAFSFADFDTF